MSQPKFKVGDKVIVRGSAVLRTQTIVKIRDSKWDVTKEYCYRLNDASSGAYIVESDLEWASSCPAVSASVQIKRPDQFKTISQFEVGDIVSYQGKQDRIEAFDYESYFTTFALLQSGSNVPLTDLQLWADVTPANNWDSICADLWDRYILD